MSSKVSERHSFKPHVRSVLITTPINQHKFYFEIVCKFKNSNGPRGQQRRRSEK